MIIFLSPVAVVAHAQEYPSKPIRAIVPFVAGGPTDIMARALGQKLSAAFGKQFIIDNRAGGGGLIAATMAKESPADGYTIFFGTISTLATNVATSKKLPYDPLKDFAPITLTSSNPYFMVVHPSVPANSVKEFMALAKAKPELLAYASVGNGSPGHLAGELFKLRTGTQMTHIPYRGGGPAVTDVISGQVPLLWVSIPAAAQFVKTGKLKAFAVSTLKRSAAFPDVPTVQETGVPDFEVDSWYAMFVPARTPQPVIDRLNRALNTIVAEPGIRDKLLAQGAEGVGGTPQTLTRIVAAEIPKWAKLAKDANIKAD